MVTDAQVRLARRKLMENKTQVAAAAASGMSERSVRTWKDGPLPSELREPRSWRTRPDPFKDVWANDVVPLLERDGERVLEAHTVLGVLEERHPGAYGVGKLRTLQRRIRDWRALHGSEKEVFFEQEHVPGREAQADFTHATDLGITVAGEALAHLVFELVLSYSGWTWADLAYGETYEALVAGVQGGFWDLGGVTAILRTDNLSAATHELKLSAGRSLNARFKAVLDHYRLDSTRIRPGKSHENGVVEQRHSRTKGAIAQALVLRGSRDFATIDAYRAFVREVVARHNRTLPAEVMAAERAALRPLPPAPVPDYTSYRVPVRKWSTVRVRGKTYSVPSRLIGYDVEVRLHPDVVEVLYGGKLVETMPRVRGQRTARIDYRHVVWSLVRKPGAFARYRFREELFPTLAFRRGYDALRASHGDRADVEYVRILHLAASTLETTVERALEGLLAATAPFDYAAVRAVAKPEQPAVPALSIPAPDLATYDVLIAGGAA